MNGWIITVAGVAVLGVLCDVIMPDGETKKYVRTVLGVVVSLVTVQYVVGLFGSVRQADAQLTSAVQNTYIEDVSARRTEQKRKLLADVCDYNGIAATFEIDDEQKIIYFALDGQVGDDKRVVLTSAVQSIFGADYKAEFSADYAEKTSAQNNERHRNVVSVGVKPKPEGNDHEQT